NRFPKFDASRHCDALDDSEATSASWRRRVAAAGSSAAQTADETATPDTPASISSARLSALMPPMARCGRFTRCRYSRRYPGPAVSLLTFVVVANIGPTPQ